MHFEVGDAKIREWHAEGVFGRGSPPAPEPVLSLGDRGPEVVALQKRLNECGAPARIDGVFGLSTHAALVAWQACNGLTPDGIVGPKHPRGARLHLNAERGPLRTASAGVAQSPA